MIRMYISHCIGGKMGREATDAYMKANNDKAIEFGVVLRKFFPGVIFYVPGDHDEFVMIASRRKFLNIIQILEIDCMIVDRCNVVIAYSPDGFISNGMQCEIDHANKAGIPVLIVDGTTESLDAIHRHLEGLKT